ncbi:hypothetical protein [Pseudophaeobacter sp.]|uniref:hypothetical protein n=1 Tax=Pseudophaeobacter sp. TaxID=1971739 RepID=UPI0032996B10
MRWICKPIIEESLSGDWRQSADNALEELKEKSTLEERKKYLRSSTAAAIWRSFYDSLPEELTKKCWYCEAEEIRSSMPIDHFRPKGKVEENEQHDGYWWLAFDWENYRCACSLCNSKRNFEDTQGGKGSHFPIFDESHRAMSPSDNPNTEKPAILDPCDPDDEKLIWFDPDGIPEPIARATDEQIQKVNNSTTIFHWHQKKICRKRNVIRLEVQRHVKNLSSVDPHTVLLAKTSLRRMIKDTEMLSRAAYVYLSQHRYIKDVEDILSQGA